MADTITLPNGVRYKTRTMMDIGMCRLSGPITMGPGGGEDDGPLIAWYRHYPGVGWVHKETGLHDTDHVHLAVRILKCEDTDDR